MIREAAGLIGTSAALIKNLIASAPEDIQPELKMLVWELKLDKLVESAPNSLYVPPANRNTILEGATNPELARLREETESMVGRLNPNAAEFVPTGKGRFNPFAAEYVPGGRRKIRRTMRGGDDDENEPETYFNQSSNQSNNNNPTPLTINNEPQSYNQPSDEPENLISGGRRKSRRRIARKHRKSRRVNRK